MEPLTGVALKLGIISTQSRQGAKVPTRGKRNLTPWPLPEAGREKVERGGSDRETRVAP